jgi:hypothetical protein
MTTWLPRSPGHNAIGWEIAGGLPLRRFEILELSDVRLFEALCK